MIRTAIIGAGIGAKHLDGYRQLPDLFAVKVICDLDEQKAQALAGLDGSIAITSHFDGVLADPSIDLIDICLPPHLHFSAVKAALAAGKHVICEKPLVRCLADADALIEVADLAGKQVFPVFQYRYGSGFDQLRALMDAGLCGKAYAASLETHWDRDAAYYSVPWRGSWAGESGGAVLGHAIHNHDLLSFVLGPVASLSAMVATRVNAIEVEDCAAISLQMESGALATSSISLGAGDNTTRLRFLFEGLTATSGTEPYAPGEDSWTFTARAPTLQSDIDAVLAKVPVQKSGFAGFFQAVAASLDGMAGHEVTLADGRRSIELVTAVYLAARTGQRVVLPLGRDCALYAGWQP